MSCRLALGHCYSSLISIGLPFAARTLFMIIERRRYSSGQKNMLAIIDARCDSQMECTFLWSKLPFRNG